MKYYLLILISVFSSFISLEGQDYPKEFGRISQEEADLNLYPGDKSADAVVLFDIGKSYFSENQNSFDVIFERTTRIKIFTEAGLKWAEVEIPFYQEGGIYEKVYDIKAYTYNYENGQLRKTALNTAVCHDEKINDYWNNKKFAMPDVKAGSIIEYKYKISSQYVFNLRDWNFQWRIPVIYSEYEVDMIPFYEYSWLLQGANKFDEQTTYKDDGFIRQFGPIKFQDMISKYTMKNLPAFKDEEYITSINDYIIKIDFQLSKIIHPDGANVSIITTWPDMIKSMLKNSHFGKYENKSEKTGSKLINLQTLQDKSPDEKFDYILNYVKSNYNWNNIVSKFCSKSADEFIKDGYGNSADINLFTVGLLNACGIEAYPVLISTRENGKIKYNYPFSHFFNYVLIAAKIDGNTILSDATDSHCSNNRIPPYCINDQGLIINKEKVEWVSLECKTPSRLNTILQMNVSDTGWLSTISRNATEYSALYFRNTYGDDKDKLIEKIRDEGYMLIDSSLNINNPENNSEPYLMKFRISDKNEMVNNKIYISPFLNECFSDNPLKQKTRTYPIDMTYPKIRTYNSIITIPVDYKTVYLPENSMIDNELFQMSYFVTSDKNKINVSFSYYFKKSVYTTDQYSIIKSYFNDIVKKGNEKIVLSKI